MELKLKINNRQDVTMAVSDAAPAVHLAYMAGYQPGDLIRLETDVPGILCEIQLDEAMHPAVVYLAGTSACFAVPFGERRSALSPKAFSGECHLLTARVLGPAERQQRRNLACNPYDGFAEPGLFPHACANVETRDEAVFAARNAIDGIFANAAHGVYPYGSWGINRDPQAALTLDFGRKVTVDELRLTLRADFPHDSWWTSVAVDFSDGSQEVLPLEKTAQPQAFPLSGRTITSLKLHTLVKAQDDSPFPALTQLEVFGTEATE